MTLYHTPGPIGGYALGWYVAGIGLFMWIAIYFWWFKYFKRKERRLAKARMEARLRPPAPLPPITRKRRRPPGANPQGANAPDLKVAGGPKVAGANAAAANVAASKVEATAAAVGTSARAGQQPGAGG